MTQTADGMRLDKFAIKRTMKAAFATVIDHWKKKGLDERHLIHVSHARALSDAENAVRLLKEAFPKVEIQILDLGAAFVTQGGPQCVALQYIEK